MTKVTYSNTEQSQLFKTIQSILQTQVQCVLATQENGNVFQHLMAYAFDEDITTIYLASYKNTQKVGNMQANPKVSLLWDNRSGNNQDHVEGFALTASGSAKVITTDSETHIREQLLKRNETLKGLLCSDEAVTITIKIERFHLAIGYKESFIYEPQ